MKKNTFLKKMDDIRKKAINATANVISAPAQIKAYRAGKQADSDVKALKTARSYDDAPNFDDSGRPTDALKARTMANEVRARLNKKYFVPTKAAGKLTPSLKAKLMKEAPETLSAPSRGSFNSNDAYKEAVRKYKANGNWASNR